MLGYARERGVTAFWSDKPNEGGTMVWSGLDGQPLNISAGDKRCVLVSTVDTSIHGFMYAELKPCTAKLADGVVCESAQAYPPPPPHGAVPDTIWKPPPPPPPIGVTTSMGWFTRKEVIPRTSAICLAGFAETDLVALCMEFANTLSRSTKVGTVGSFTPLCQPVCFHSCGASSNQDRDGFENCRGEECADTTCGQFLLTCVCLLEPLHTPCLSTFVHAQTCECPSGRRAYVGRACPRGQASQAPYALMHMEEHLSTTLAKWKHPVQSFFRRREV